ncbi:TetR/AcrR family transcriptional regulator [Actinoallomurus sp. NPDC052274]|uniref:TetR/AcrR family transcriptional regulator n=1 Tax=Actinoallomurus sp. NPDC052274 TaxID=3155420 RepID=UPI0034396EF8
MSLKVEQGEATRAALVDAAIALFTDKGFAETSTTEIVRRAGVTRGALYHHFADKEKLFRAAHEAIEKDIFQRARTVSETAEGGAVERLKAGADAFLDSCLEPAVRRILLIEGPLVLGWQRSLDFDNPHCARRLLRASVAQLRPDEAPEPLAHLLFGALWQAGLVVAAAPERRAEMAGALQRMVDNLFDG